MQYGAASLLGCGKVVNLGKQTDPPSPGQVFLLSWHPCRDWKRTSSLAALTVFDFFEAFTHWYIEPQVDLLVASTLGPCPTT